MPCGARWRAPQVPRDRPRADPPLGVRQRVLGRTKKRQGLLWEEFEKPKKHGFFGCLIIFL